jgi:hypothetical protein
MKHASYTVVHDRIGEALVIVDLGPWDKFPTVTNDAENVVAELVARGRLPADRRLFCFDSENNLDELLIKNGNFAGFKPGPRPRACRVCGCTDDHVCEGGCQWVSVDLCSACA